MSQGRLVPAAAVILLCLGSASPLWSQAGALEDGPEEGQGARGGVRQEEAVDTAASGGLLQDARMLAEEGKLAQAAAAYAGWLERNAGRHSFGEVLIEAAESQLSIERALELLRVYTPRVRDPLQRELCLASQIDLLRMLGRTEQALSLLRSYPSSPQWLYRQAQLLYQQGLVHEAEQALGQARSLLGREADTPEEGAESAADEGGPDPQELEARIWLLQARIYILEDKHRDAESLFKIMNAKYAGTGAAPGILLAYYEYLLSVGKEKAAEAQMQRLAERFPGSPELALAAPVEGEGRIGRSPTPSRLLPRSLEREGPSPQPAARDASGAMQDASLEGGGGGMQDGSTEEGIEAAEGGGETAPAGQPVRTLSLEPPQPQKVMVQTGSFRDPENAQFMVRDLKASGFEASIVEKRIAGTLYYRVVVGSLMPQETAQAVLMKLKDASFEGVFLFPD
jgi:tetratricopeptide (TPR) repeat protein